MNENSISENQSSSFKCDMTVVALMKLVLNLSRQQVNMEEVSSLL